MVIIVLTAISNRYQFNNEYNTFYYIHKSMLFDSVVSGAGLRVRPVLMTAGATTVGLLPIMYGSGTGSEVMSRIAAPMIGGMTSAVILALLVCLAYRPPLDLDSGINSY